MSVKIRPAVATDASSILAIAQSVEMPSNQVTAQQQRGFLLDSSLEHYQYFIVNDDVLVVEESDPKQIVGFSIVLGSGSVVACGIQKKADRIRWEGSFIDRIKDKKFAYYEQFAFLPEYPKRTYTLYLFFASLRRVFQHYFNLFGAVVRYPIRNRAPLPFANIVGEQKVGSIDEDYPDHGRVVYDIYHLDRVVFNTKLQEPFFRSLVKRIRAQACLDQDLMTLP